MRPIIVCGSRDGASYGEVEYAMDRARDWLDMPAFNFVVVGSRKGVDVRAFDWAMHREIPAAIVPALWQTGGRGKGEGPIRNRRMLALFPTVAVLAFPGGSGTEDMVAAAKGGAFNVWRWLGRADGWRRDR